MGRFDLRQFKQPEQVAESAAADCLKLISEKATGENAFTLALSGGRIAKTFCVAMATQAKNRLGALRHTHFFWSDERCVPPDDTESNFRLADETLLRPLGIAPAQIHRIEGEKPLAESFATAEAHLRKLASFTPTGQPILDLILLGMGEDGHVASLFPGEPEEQVRNPAMFRCVTAVKPPPRRVTMGYGVVAAARDVWVLASGHGKAGALRHSLEPHGRTPLARVLQMRDSVRIYTDIPVAPI